MSDLRFSLQGCDLFPNLHKLFSLSGAEHRASPLSDADHLVQELLLSFFKLLDLVFHVLSPWL